MTRLLRAPDAAVTAFVNEMYPFPVLTPLDDFDEGAAAQYLTSDCGLGARPSDPPLTNDEIRELRQMLNERFVIPTSADGDAAPRRPAESTPRVAAVPPAGDTGRSPLDRF